MRIAGTTVRRTTSMLCYVTMVFHHVTVTIYMTHVTIGWHAIVVNINFLFF